MYTLRNRKSYLFGITANWLVILKILEFLSLLAKYIDRQYFERIQMDINTSETARG